MHAYCLCFPHGGLCLFCNIPLQHGSNFLYQVFTLLVLFGLVMFTLFTELIFKKAETEGKFWTHQCWQNRDVDTLSIVLCYVSLKNFVPARGGHQLRGNLRVSLACAADVHPKMRVLVQGKFNECWMNEWISKARENNSQPYWMHMMVIHSL